MKNNVWYNINVLERDIVRKIQRWLAKQPKTFAYKHWGGYYGRPGIPDLIVCHRGRFVGIEVKRPERNSKTTEAQEQVLSEIRAAGGIGLVARDLETVKEVFKFMNGKSIEEQRQAIKQGMCPVCGSKLVHESGCVTCPSCGWGLCG